MALLYSEPHLDKPARPYEPNVWSIAHALPPRQLFSSFVRQLCISRWTLEQHSSRLLLSIFRSMRWGLRLTAQKLKKKKQKACSAEKKKNVLQNRKPRWINDWRCPEAKWNPSLSRKSMKARQKGRSLGSPQKFFPTWRSGRQIIPEGISRNTHSWVSLKDLLFPRGRVESNRDREKIC